MSTRERHQIYLTDLVWAELKKNAALQPGQNASSIIEYLLEGWLQSGSAIQVPSRHAPGHRPDRGVDESAGRRTLFLRRGLWQAVEQHARSGGYSVSMLIEQLLRAYLDL